MSSTPIDALTRARNMAARKSANWAIEAMRADSVSERIHYEAMQIAADAIENAILVMIENEKVAP